MSQGFGSPNRGIEERDRLHHQLELARRENRILRRVLTEIRPVLITNKHKHAVDKALKSWRL